MKIRKKENSYNLVCFYPGRVPQKAISKSTIRTVIALANRKHGQSYTVESSTTLFVPCACFYICFQPFKQASHYIKDNRCISLSLQAVYLNHLCSNFPNHLLEKENNLHVLPFWWQNWKKWGSSKSTESLTSRWKIFIFSSVYMTIDPGTSSVVASSSCLVELLLAIFWAVFTGFSRFYASPRICSSFRNRKEPMAHFQNAFFCFWLFDRWQWFWKYF